MRTAYLFNFKPLLKHAVEASFGYRIFHHLTEKSYYKKCCSLATGAHVRFVEVCSHHFKRFGRRSILNLTC